MHQSAPPDWSNWPPSSRPMSERMHGHDPHLGQTLGLLLAHNDRQTRVLERISDRIDDLPKNIAKALPSQSPTPLSAASWSKDRAQWLVAIAIVILAVLGKGEAASVLAKLIGLGLNVHL